MQLVVRIAQDRHGAVLPFAEAHVYLKGTSTPATLYTADGVQTDNPVQANENGVISFRAADGLYDLQLSFQGELGIKTPLQCIDGSEKLAQMDERVTLVQEAEARVNTAKNEATQAASEAKTAQQDVVAKVSLAKDSADAAKVSETNSKNSETAAKTAETNSKASETAAKASEIASKGSETAADSSADAALASETNAKASETASKTSETNSKDSETKAKASETAAKTSETNSKASETAAKAAQLAAEEAAAQAGSGGADLSGYLKKADNLSGLADNDAALGNLGGTKKGDVDGLANFAALRTREPKYDGERVYIRCHTASTLAVFKSEGAGWFIGRKTAQADDGGYVASSGQAWHWVRDKQITDLYIGDFGGVADGILDSQPAFKRNLDFVVSSYAAARVGNRQYTLPIRFGPGDYFITPGVYTTYGAKVAEGASDAQFNPSGYYAASGIYLCGARVASGKQLTTRIRSDKSDNPVFTINHRRLSVTDMIWDGQQTVAQDATTKMLVGATKGIFNDTASNKQPFMMNQCPGGCFSTIHRFNANNTGSYTFYLLDTLDSTYENIFSSNTAGPIFQIGWSGQTYGAWDHSTSIVLRNCNFSVPMSPVVWAPRVAQGIIDNVWSEHGVCPFDLNNGQWDINMWCIEDCVDNPILWYTKSSIRTLSVPTGNSISTDSPTSGNWKSYPKNPDGSDITAWTGGYDQGSYMLQSYGAYFNCPVVTKWNRGVIRVTNNTDNTLYLNIGSFRNPTNGGFWRVRVLGGIYYNTSSTVNMLNDYLPGEATINIMRGTGATPKISWYSEGQGPISGVQYQTQGTNDIQPAVWVAIRPRAGEVTVFVEGTGLHRHEAGIPADYVPSGATTNTSPGLNTVSGRFNFNTGQAGFGAAGAIAEITSSSVAAVNQSLTTVSTDTQFLNEPVHPNIIRWERLRINGQEMAVPIYAWKPAFTTSAPATVSVATGGTLTLTTVVTDAVSQQWQFSSDNGTTWTNISGATGVVYTKAGVVAGDAGQYRLAVRANNGAGGAGITTFGSVTTVTVT